MRDSNADRIGFKKVKAGWIPNTWDFRNIGSFCKLRSGGTPSRKRPEYWGGTIPWATTSAINYGVITHTSECITEKGLKESSAVLFDEGTLVMAMYGQGATRGRVAILGRAMAFNQACLAIVPNEKHALVQFMYHRLVYDYHRIRAYSQGGNQSNLSADLISGIKVLLPSIREQKKIAEILSTCDEAIKLTRKLIDLKKLRKKGLTQQLVGGKKNLKGLPGEWYLIPIGKLLKTVSRPLVWEDEMIYSLLSIRRRSGGVFLRERRQGSDIKTKVMFEAKAGDFLISKMQVLHGATGLVPNELDGMHISGSYIILRARDGAEIDMRFFARLSSTPEFYHLTYVSSYGVHIEKMTFNLNWFLKAKITLPTDRREQAEIANRLDIVDEEISYHKAQLKAMEKQKRGLMQTLLTGTMRVKT